MQQPRNPSTARLVSPFFRRSSKSDEVTKAADEHVTVLESVIVYEIIMSDLVITPELCQLILESDLC